MKLYHHQKFGSTNSMEKYVHVQQKSRDRKRETGYTMVLQKIYHIHASTQRFRRHLRHLNICIAETAVKQFNSNGNKNFHKYFKKGC